MEIKFLKFKKTFKKGGIHINPDIYWGAALSIAFVIIAIVVFFAFNLFSRINQESILAVDNSSTKNSSIAKDRIDGILEYFNERKAKSDQILNSPSPLIDPSR